MRKIITMAIAMLMASGVFASAENVKVKASGKIVSKEITGKSGFNEIVLKGAVDVNYYVAADTRIIISASDNVIPYIEVEKKGASLEVGIKKNVSISVRNSKADLKVKVYAPNVSSFSVKGSGDIKILTDLKADRLAFGVSGSGDIDAYNLKAGEVALGVSGSGDIEVRNVKANKIALGITGSGDIKCETTEAAEVALGVTGSGDIKVHCVASEKLSCGVTGSGDIVLSSGNVGEAAYATSGSGDIKAMSVKVKNVTATVSGSGDIACRATSQVAAAATGTGEVHYYGNPAKVVGKGKNVKKR